MAKELNEAVMYDYSQNMHKIDINVLEPVDSD